MNPVVGEEPLVTRMTKSQRVTDKSSFDVTPVSRHVRFGQAAKMALCLSMTDFDIIMTAILTSFNSPLCLSDMKERAH